MEQHLLRPQALTTTQQPSSLMIRCDRIGQDWPYHAFIAHMRPNKAIPCTGRSTSQTRTTLHQTTSSPHHLQHAKPRSSAHLRLLCDLLHRKCVSTAPCVLVLHCRDSGACVVICLACFFSPRSSIALLLANLSHHAFLLCPACYDWWCAAARWCFPPARLP